MYQQNPGGTDWTAKPTEQLAGVVYGAIAHAAVTSGLGSPGVHAACVLVQAPLCRVGTIVLTPELWRPLGGTANIVMRSVALAPGANRSPFVKVGGDRILLLS